MNKEKNIKEFKTTLLTEPPIPCDFKVGDKVNYTNEFNVSFEDLTIIGFSKEIDDNHRFIHLDSGCYWFPVPEYALSPKGQPPVVRDRYTKDLILNNGEKAKFIEISDSYHIVYQLKNGKKVCTTDLMEKTLYDMAPSGEPEFPLPMVYQIKSHEDSIEKVAERETLRNAFKRRF